MTQPFRPLGSTTHKRVLQFLLFSVFVAPAMYSVDLNQLLEAAPVIGAVTLAAAIPLWLISIKMLIKGLKNIDHEICLENYTLTVRHGESFTKFPLQDTSTQCTVDAMGVEISRGNEVLFIPASCQDTIKALKALPSIAWKTKPMTYAFNVLSLLFILPFLIYKFSEYLS